MNSHLNPQISIKYESAFESYKIRFIDTPSSNIEVDMNPIRYPLCKWIYIHI
jgi:hypothetical protein